MNHREAWAEERKAPATVESSAPAETQHKDTEEILVVASKVKDYISDRSGMNTAADVLIELSKHVRELSLAAIEVARGEGRKTVMERDFRVKPNTSPPINREGIIRRRAQ